VFPRFWRAFVLPKEQIRRISARHGIFVGSIYFEHTCRSSPQLLTFASAASLELVYFLRDLGYPMAQDATEL
jgi:hypothetical protein